MASDEEKQLAATHLAQGKRHLMVKDYFEAVSSLASACEYLAKIYGDDANECGDAYFNYGKALLELARSENGVLGNAVEEENQSGDDEDESNEEEPEKDKEESEVKPDQNGNANAENADSSTTNKPTDESVDGKIEVGGGDAENVVNTTADPSKDEVSEPKTNGQNGSLEPTAESNEDGEEEDGEVSNLKLAWEILELAKTIFQRQSESDKTMELKLAEVHLLLGEIGLESENFTQGTDDMLMCLELQKKNLEPDNRRIAETYYQIGMGYGMANRFDDAIEAYTSCGKILDERISNLKNMIKQGLKPDGDDPFYSYEGEIKDVEELLPEIKEKVLDMRDFKNETKKALLSATMKPEGSDAGAGSSKEPTFPDSSTAFGSESSSFGYESTFTGSRSSSTTAAVIPVSNISHLVRKKPRPEPESEQNGPENVKRICTEEDKTQ